MAGWKEKLQSERGCCLLALVVPLMPCTPASITMNPVRGMTSAGRTEWEPFWAVGKVEVGPSICSPLQVSENFNAYFSHSQSNHQGRMKVTFCR